MKRWASAVDGAQLLYRVVPTDWLWTAARWRGRLAYLVDRRRRRIARENFKAVLALTEGPGEPDELTRQAFEDKHVRNLMVSLAPRLSYAEKASLVPAEGMEHLDAALASQRGVVLLGSHLNSIALFVFAMALRDRGYDVRVAIPEQRDPWPPSALGRILNRRFNAPSVAEAMGAFYAQFNIRPIVRSLGENAVVAQTGDGLHSARFVEVDFLRRRVPFPTGMQRIAQITGAVVVPAFLVGSPPDEMRVVLEEPWTVARDHDPEAALRERVEHYAARLEQHLLENLACWEHWFIEDALDTIASWPERGLEERYKI